MITDAAVSTDEPTTVDPGPSQASMYELIKHLEGLLGRVGDLMMACPALERTGVLTECSLTYVRLQDRFVKSSPQTTSIDWCLDQCEAWLRLLYGIDALMARCDLNRSDPRIATLRDQLMELVKSDLIPWIEGLRELRPDCSMFTFDWSNWPDLRARRTEGYESPSHEFKGFQR